MTWWQILLIIVSWVIIWSMGAIAGYEAGWLAQLKAKVERASDNSASGSQS